MLIFIFLGILLPLLLLAALGAWSLNLAVVCAWILLLIASFRISILLENRRPRFISIFFWSFIYLFMALIPFFQIGTNIYPRPEAIPIEDLLSVFLILFIGIIGFEIGLLLPRTNLINKKYNHYFSEVFLKRKLSYIRLKSLFFIGLSAIIIFAMVAGFDAVFLPRQERMILLAELAGGEGKSKFIMLLTTLRVPLVVALWGFLILWVTYSNKSYLYWAIASGLGALAINNPVSTPRFWLGTIIVSCVLIMFSCKNKLPMKVLIVSFILSVIFIFPIADAFRHSAEASELSFYLKNATLEYNLLDKADFDAFQQSAKSVQYVEEEGVFYGRQLLGAVLFWFPRSLWDDKPQSSGYVIAENFGYLNHNISVPLWSEMYLNGGIVLVFFSFLIFGNFVYTLESKYIALRSQGQLGFLIVAMFAPYQFFLLRGTLMASFAYLVPIVVIAFFISYPHQKLATHQ